MSRNRRRHQQAMKRHSERLSAIDCHLEAGEYFQAAESARRVLCDPTLSPEVRIRTKGREVEALIGASRKTEAYQAAVDLERMIERFRLWTLRAEFQPLIDRIRGFQGA